MTEKAAQTYVAGTSDIIITANQFLTGAQIIAGDPDLLPQNILYGVQIFGVNGTLTVPTISQDSATKVLTIQ